MSLIPNPRQVSTILNIIFLYLCDGEILRYLLNLDHIELHFCFNTVTIALEKSFFPNLLFLSCFPIEAIFPSSSFCLLYLRLYGFVFHISYLLWLMIVQYMYITYLHHVYEILYLFVGFSDIWVFFCLFVLQFDEKTHNLQQRLTRSLYHTFAV